MKCFTSIVLLLLMADSCIAAVGVSQGGSGQCFSVVSDLKRHWIEVKRHLLPGTAEIKKPENHQFICLSRAHTRNAIESRTAAGASLRCFRNSMGNGMGFCCDATLLACAQLNPYLFPEVIERPSAGEKYAPPASLWVKPPEDGEQWKSN